MHTKEEKASCLNRGDRQSVMDFVLECGCWQCLQLGSAHVTTLLPCQEVKVATVLVGSPQQLKGLNVLTSYIHGSSRRKWCRKSNSLGTQSKQIISKLFIKCEHICLSKLNVDMLEGTQNGQSNTWAVACEIYSYSDPSLLVKAESNWVLKTNGLQLQGNFRQGPWI